MPERPVELAHHRDLAQEFPELKARIRELKLQSPAFRRGYADYQALDNEIHRIEQQIETPSDDYTEERKRRRVLLKDRLYGMLTGRVAPATGADEFVVRHKFAPPVAVAAVTSDWIKRGFACRALSGPPGQVWRDAVHDSDKLVTVVDGCLEVTMRGENWELAPGDELYIPRGVVHTVRNLNADTTRWLYGYD